LIIATYIQYQVPKSYTNNAKDRGGLLETHQPERCLMIIVAAVAPEHERYATRRYKRALCLTTNYIDPRGKKKSRCTPRG
jgi:hypothetical protein